MLMLSLKTIFLFLGANTYPRLPRVQKLHFIGCFRMAQNAPQPAPILVLPPILESKYKIVRQLGQGAYGIVW